jgi:hypothetical protein
MPPTPFRYLSQEEQLALAVVALGRALAGFKSYRATLKTRRLLDSVVPPYAQTAWDRLCFIRVLERLLGQVVVDDLGRPWLVLWVRKDSHDRTTVALRRLDGVSGEWNSQL